MVNGGKHKINTMRSEIDEKIMIYREVRPGSVDSLNGGSTDAMKKSPVEK